jgi:pimeloyl-ACP methyl ester carboxylesterase
VQSPWRRDQYTVNRFLSQPRQRSVRVILPTAIDAPYRTLDSSRAGRLRYYEDRSGSGPPLVLVHSINAAPSAFEMRPLFERFRSKHPVYALDLPGFGHSERSNRRYTPELFADAIADLLVQTVRVPAHVVAFSLSAEFAARVALSQCELVASLALISPTGFSRRPLPSATLSDRLHKGLSLPLLSQGLFDVLTSRPSIRYFLSQAFVGEVPPELIEYAYATSHQPGARYAPLYFLSGQLFTPQAIDRLYANLQLPVLVIYDRDPNVSFDLLPGFVSGRENWHAVRITPTLGLPHWEKTAETAEAMEQFWAKGRKS